MNRDEIVIFTDDETLTAQELAEVVSIDGA